MKGESSGHVLHVHDLHTDCDQDVLWITCTLADGNDGKPAGACHTGYRTCFYRKVDPDTRDLIITQPAKAFDPDQVYH